MTSKTTCKLCRSDNAVTELFHDDERGYITECGDCKYTEVYRENVASNRIVEFYQGHEHQYSGQLAGLESPGVAV